MVAVVAVATNLTQLVLAAVLVVVDQMVVTVDKAHIQDHLSKMFLDKVIKVEMVNPQLLAAVEERPLLVIMLLAQMPEQVVLDYHIVLVASQNSMLAVAVVVTESLLVAVVPQVVQVLVVTVKDNLQFPVVMMLYLALVLAVEAVELILVTHPVVVVMVPVVLSSLLIHLN